MKQLTSYNRVAGYLNKLFDLLNQRFFESALSRPTITIQSTPRAYGHFSMRDDTWVSVTGSSNEINIGAGTLARPIENVCATLLHEMVHYYCHVNGIKDTSRGNTYHNKRFKGIAESHGLKVSHHEKYGWTITEPNLRPRKRFERYSYHPQRVLRRIGFRNRNAQQHPASPAEDKQQSEIYLPLLREQCSGN